MESKWNIIALLGIMMMVIAAPAAGQPTSFLIDGWVNDSNGDPVNDPSVTVTNLNTDEVFTVETDASSNYYQVMTCSDNVSTNDMLNFSVDGGTAFDHAVTQDEMDDGGFEENLTVEATVEPDFIEIGDETVTEYCVPFHGNWDYGWSKIIYTKSEIGAPITITKIAFNVSKPAGYSYAVNDQRIYMGHITNASFDGDESKPDPSTMNEVYNGGITWESGWTIITLDTSFSYNNVDNLLIYYENQDGSYESNQPLWYRTLTLPDYRSVYNYADDSFPTDDGDQVRFIPNIQLHYGGVATGIAVSKTVYDPDAGEWVDTISGAIPGETYRFRIDVTATGCDFTDVVVNDTLSPSLSYAGNPSPSAPAVIGDVYQWTFEALNESETMTIEFDATVSYRGLDCNLVSATGWCNETAPEQFSDEATACIDSRVDLAVKSDWNEHIKVNPACHNLEYYRIIVNESNTIRVWIINNGPSNITSGEEFNVCFDLNGVEIACVALQGPLNASEDRYYDIEWTPDCTPIPEWHGYPPMPGYPSTELSGYTLNVTVDCPDCPSCSSGGAINETDEDNNQGYRAVYICNNGYKSKNIDCGPSDPLTSFVYNEMYGGVAYNVSGSKNYPFETGETDTRIHHIEIPAGMTVVNARLYVYWYDYFYNPAPGCLANLGVNFGGTTFTTPDASYNDQKGFGTWNSPKGTYAYDVTSLVTGSGDYTVVVENIDPANYTTLLGEMLLVVYEDPTQDPNNRIQLWIMEGCDLLKGDAGYCVTPDEATANSIFHGAVDMSALPSAELITVVSQGMEPGNKLLFNGNVIKTDAWNASSEAGPKSGDVDGSRINVEVVDVTDSMTASGNNVGFRDTGTGGMQASNAILVVEEEVSLMPDLTVTDLLVNPGNTRDSILRVYVNDSNNISAVVYNAGSTGVTGDFDVCFEADGAKIGCATVTGGLAAGADTIVSIDWTPACADYPVMPGFPPQSLPLTINVTVDCNCSNCPICPDGSCGTITESDETNNTLSKVIPAMQVYSTYNVIGGVVNNGYRSKNFDCDTTEEPLDQFEYYDLIGGGVEYNVSGEKISTFAPQATSTRVHHIDLPSGAIVEDARLYAYWYDKWGNYKTYPTGCLADLSVNFSGTDLTPDAAYQDSKGFGYYQSPKGSTVFDVTSLVSGSGDYTAIVKNAEPTGGNNTTLLGEMLVVVYSGADHGHTVQIWMLEGTDYLMAADDTHNSYDYSVSPEEATATVTFGGSINLADVESASLITVVAQGQSPGSDMLFNGDVIKTDAWDTPTEAYPNSKIDIEDLSVMDNLTASGNTLGFRDTGTGGMQASNAFLVVEYEEEPVASYGDSIYAKKNVRLARRALGEPDNRGAILSRNAMIAIELEETIPACKDVSIWVRKVAVRPASFDVAVSSDGVSWTVIGSGTCNSWMWTEYDFDGDFGDVRYIKITKPGTWWKPRIMALDAVYATN